MKLLKEPLLHFLLIGAALFAFYEGFSVEPDPLDSREIVVTREDLLRYIQYRAKAFDAKRFDRMLAEMPKEELQSFIDDYVREEALYRQAKSLELDRNDYVARRRLIQQLEFITRGFVEEATTLTDADLQDYFKAHRQNYYQPAEITFTHVFFSAERRGREEAREAAKEMLATLNKDNVPFHEAMTYGDRYLYHTNYVGKRAKEVASHFSEAMQKQLFALTSDENAWRGPISSPYGEHLVMVRSVEPGYEPTLADVRERVKQDALRERREAAVEKAIQSVVQGYDVTVGKSLREQGA